MILIITLLFFKILRNESVSYDPEEILSRSIQKEKSNDHAQKAGVSDPRRQDGPDRFRSRSSFSDRFLSCFKSFILLLFKN